MITQMERTAGRRLRPTNMGIATLSLVVLIAGVAFIGCTDENISPELADSSPLAEGQRIFRFDTFGDEQYWNTPPASMRWWRSIFDHLKRSDSALRWTWIS